MASGVQVFDGNVQKALAHLSAKSGKKIARAAITKGLRIITKSIKAKVPPQYKSAKKAIGQKLKMNAKGVTAKVGAAVGKKKSAAMDARAADRPGVGISTANIHWMILGTGERNTKTKGRRGVMPPILGGIVKEGFKSAEAQAAAAIKQSVSEGLIKEAAAATLGVR